MLTGVVREAHASWLKFYADSSLGITDDLLAHVAHNSEGHVVEELRQARYDPARKAYDILAKWYGLSDAESSWEPAQHLLEDTPAVCLQA